MTTVVPSYPLEPGRSSHSIDARLGELPQFTNAQLRTLWQRQYQVQVPKGLSRDLLIRFIAYRLQEEAIGGLGKAPLRRLQALGDRLRAPDRDEEQRSVASLKPGTTLIREWNGRTHTVLVLEDGFEFRGKRFASLTKVAAAISGLHRSGPAFFGLNRTLKRFAEQGRGFIAPEVSDE